jgi:hypothetical protein
MPVGYCTLRVLPAPETFYFVVYPFVPHRQDSMLLGCSAKAFDRHRFIPQALIANFSASVH